MAKEEEEEASRMRLKVASIEYAIATEMRSMIREVTAPTTTLMMKKLMIMTCLARWVSS